MIRPLWFSLGMALLLSTGALGAADRFALPLALRAVDGEPCEPEGWTGGRMFLESLVVHGKVVGLEGVDGPEMPVEPTVVFPRIAEARQGVVWVRDGLFRSSAVFMREERISCEDGSFVVERSESSLPEMVVRAPGCLTERFRLEATEIWMDLELQCGYLRRSV